MANWWLKLPYDVNRNPYMRMLNEQDRWYFLSLLLLQESTRTDQKVVQWRELQKVELGLGDADFDKLVARFVNIGLMNPRSLGINPPFDTDPVSDEAKRKREWRARQRDDTVRDMSRTSPPNKSKNQTQTQTDKSRGSLEEITAFTAEKNLAIDPEEFFLAMQGSGWKTRAGPVKCWRSTIQHWDRSRKKNGGGGDDHLYR